MGKHYFDTGRWTLALEHWELAWEATRHYPAGREKRIADFTLAVLPPHRLSFLGTTNVRRELQSETQTRIIFPPGYDPGTHLVDHLEFALKHEGINLEVLAAFFRRVDRNAFEEELSAAIRAQPLGQYRRRLWFSGFW